MCGRYAVVTKIEEIEKKFGVKAEQPDLFSQNVNISPGNLAPVITLDNPELLQFFSFGLSPFWAKKRMYLFNARSEGDHNKENDHRYSGAKGIINKPAFRTAIRKKRCLVVADCFYEGPQKERLSKPYAVYMRDGDRPFAFAGLYDRWVNKETGEVYDTFAIITTVNNSLLRKIGHHRSPVILPPEWYKEWLSNEVPLNDITAMLQPYPGEKLNAYPISTDIKNPRANDIELLKPIGERIEPEYDYEVYQDLKLYGMGATTARQRKMKRDGELF